MAMKPAKVPHDELQDFWEGCKNAGYNEGEFMVIANEDVPVEPGHIARVIGVQRTSKGKIVGIEFDGSSGKDWIGPAIDAVIAGKFGAP